MTAAPRQPGLLNLRDLGGIRTADGGEIAPGRLLRSAEPVGLSDDEVAWLLELGVASRIDLRSAGEPDQAPCTELDRAGVEAHHVPFRGLTAAQNLPDVAEDEDLGRRYAQSVTANVDGLERIMRLLSDKVNSAVLIHCAWGKDRAGIVTAAVLELLGVPREAIVADYVRSEEAVDALLARALSHRGPIRAARARRKAADRPIVHARRATITTYLDVLEATHGGAAGLLRAHGVDVEELSAALRTQLLA